MKISKSIASSLLVRPYRWKGQSRIGLSLMLLVNTKSGAPVIESESKLWKVAAEHLDSQGIIEYGIPKVYPEFLVSGYAYTAHQQDKTSIRVAVEVNDKKRELLVTGDRYFDGDKISNPLAFESLPLSWANSYGGGNYENNPLGRGAEDILRENVAIRELPNIEDPTQQVIDRQKIYRAVNFGAQSITWPIRFSKVGSYTEKWQKTDFPGFFDDMDPSLFNAAQDEQIWFDQVEFTDNTLFNVKNMHPEKPQWSGIVPAWRGRCLIELQENETTEPLIRDVFLSLKTLWLIPHLESYIVIFQGSVPCWYEDGAEIKHVLAAVEWKHSPKEAAHYTSFMRTRENHDESALLAYLDEDLLPENVQIDTIAPTSEMKGHLATKLSQLQKYMYSMAREQLTTMGVDANHFLPEIVGPMPSPLVDMRMLPEEQKLREQQLQQMKEHLKEVKEASIRFKRTAGKDKTVLELLGGEDYLKQIITQGDGANVSRQETALSTFAESFEGIDTVQMEKTQQRQQQLYAMSAHLHGNTFIEDKTKANVLRELVLQAINEQKPLEHMDLTGADLSGLVFDGVSFKASVLKKANLRQSTFKNCCFDMSALCYAELTASKFEQCTFEMSNISLCTMDHCLFESCQFQKMTIEQLKVQHSYFNHCDFSEIFIQQGEFQQSAFNVGVLEGTVFVESSLVGVEFTETQMNKCAFMNTSIEKSAFIDCHIVRLAINDGAIVHTQFTKSWLEAISVKVDQVLANNDFTQVYIKNSSLRQQIFEQVNFSEAILDNTDFSLSIFKNAAFNHSQTPQSIFGRAKFLRVDFTGANLSHSLMGRCVFEAVNFTHVNFFRTELALSHFSDDCIEHENYMVLAQLEPSQREAT
ncbi:hypothetical protein V757_12655 [Pelistega indica]|uniref:DUF2169 domain-containing protein n=1 Tax=Pelistega indica TaxID=1414851 RepID=V8FSS2_9BURK|nr:DUF2169 domain-containing protein [Pelistega indica]ETD66442.1 hypothetical protein V757_12655 [Pelistega indica]